MKTQDLNNCSSTNYSTLGDEIKRMNTSNYLKGEIVKFVLNNRPGYENLTFIEELVELTKLEWVLVQEDSYERTNTHNEFESHFMDIHFEMQHRHGRHLLVGRYAYENNPRRNYYVGFYFKVESIENGILNFSLISFISRYQKMNDLKNAVAEYEIKNNCFSWDLANHCKALTEKYLKN